MRRPQLFPVTVLIPAASALSSGSTAASRAALSPFRIGRTPVTNGEYAPFLAGGGAAPPPWWSDLAFCGPGQPVVGVTWEDASAYCAWLTAIDSGRWRLPSEAEWERAISGGVPHPKTPWGETLPSGEIPVGPLAGPWRVGCGTPNAFGVLDPGTIVHEWCLDWRDPAPSAAPAGAALPRRASRGGSWRHRIRWSAPSARSSLPPAFRYSDYGFRVLREEHPAPVPAGS
ncbi:MAG: SUMF1/EgtB/PvdO family nonheme iron enzyme [Acidobacteriota bacterium]